MSVYAQNDGSLSTGVVVESGTAAKNGLTGATTIACKRVAKVSVTVTGSAAGSVSDTTGTIAVLPNAVGVISLDWPVNGGTLTVTPGTGQTVSVSYDV